MLFQPTFVFGGKCSKCQSRNFLTGTSLAQEKTQNLTQLWSPLPFAFIAGNLSHRVAFPSALPRGMTQLL